jgi:hypothetical protein
MVPNVLCKEIIEKFESDSRKRQGELGNGSVDTTVKNCVDLNIGVWPQWKVQNNRLRDIFMTAFMNYITNLRLNVFGEDKAHIVDQIFNNPNTTLSGFQMQRYGVGGLFKWHIDFDPYINRVCNFIVYLNDHESCTEFLNGKIKPEAGKIVFFPTTWVHAHCGQPVERGNKYIITGFIFYKEEMRQSLPFIVKYD